MCDMMEYLGYFAGFYILAKLGLFVFNYIYCSYIATPVNPAKMGEWALVTGSTDGIGKAYAEQLAKRGMNIVLVSRTPFKLQNVAAEIEEKYKVKTKIIDIDFTQNDSDYIPRIKEETSGLEIGVLVNNVGMSYDYPEEFLDIPDGEEKVKKLIACNITTVNAMVRTFLPEMVKRKKGVVINLSSLTGMFNMPMLTVYAASKAYVDNFTRGLETEYGRKGITVQCIMPGYVVSNMSKMRKPTWMVPLPSTFVKSALSRLGIQSRTTGYWAHDLMAWVMRTVPEWMNTQLTYNQMVDIRKRALRKKEK